MGLARNIRQPENQQREIKKQALPSLPKLYARLGDCAEVRTFPLRQNEDARVPRTVNGTGHTGLNGTGHESHDSLSSGLTSMSLEQNSHSPRGRHFLQRFFEQRSCDVFQATGSIGGGGGRLHMVQRRITDRFTVDRRDGRTARRSVPLHQRGHATPRRLRTRGTAMREPSLPAFFSEISQSMKPCHHCKPRQLAIG